jgi:hypothetical protein
MEWYRDNVSNICDDPDEQLVQDVLGYMRMQNLSQGTLGKELAPPVSRYSVSKWLSLQYDPQFPAKCKVRHRPTCASYLWAHGLWARGDRYLW